MHEKRPSGLRFRAPSRYGRALARRPMRPLAVILKAEDLLKSGADDEEIRETLELLPREGLGSADLHTRAGWCFLGIRELREALGHFDRALELEPDSADALHGRGTSLMDLGDERRAIAAWLRVRELDLVAQRVEWTLAPEAFEAIADAVMAELPAAIRDRLVNVPIFHADYPDESHVREGLDPRALGLFSGLPLPEKSVMGEGAPVLDGVFLFQRNIERIASGPEHAKEEIRITLIHETGHFFGLDDEDLEALGLG